MSDNGTTLTLTDADLIAALPEARQARHLCSPETDRYAFCYGRLIASVRGRMDLRAELAIGRLILMSDAEFAALSGQGEQ